RDSLDSPFDLPRLDEVSESVLFTRELARGGRRVTELIGSQVHNAYSSSASLASRAADEMSPAKLAEFPCKYCGKSFSDGRRLGGHVRQSHPVLKRGAAPQTANPFADGEYAARVMELWR